MTRPEPSEAERNERIHGEPIAALCHDRDAGSIVDAARCHA